MRLLGMLSWLSVRELWISFRLLAGLALLLAASLPLAFLPSTVVPYLAGAPPDRIAWFAMALAGALSVVAALAAYTLAAERRRGTSGWLVLRAVPRSAILLGWYAAFGLVLALGLLFAGLLGWLTLAAEPLVAGRPLPFGVALLAVLAAGLACVSLGLGLGAVLPRVPAALLTLAISAAALLTGALRTFELPSSPFAGLAVLAHLDDAGAPLADALRSGGTALALSAVLLVLAAALLERVDL